LGTEVGVGTIWGVATQAFTINRIGTSKQAAERSFFMRGPQREMETYRLSSI
jgi:hypothetical protein